MGLSYVVTHVALSRAPEGFNRKDLIFFHLCLVVTLHDRYTFAAMDTMLDDIVAIEVANTFNRQRMAVELYFVAFHGFLDSSTDVAHPHIDASFLNSVNCDPMVV